MDAPRGLGCVATSGSILFVAHPADELTNADVPLDAIWGDAATARLRERLLSARAPAAALDVLEQTLWEAWRDRGGQPAVAYALNRFRARPAVARIADVTARIGISEKWFIDRFRSEVGVTPKRFCRLLRFQQVVATAHALRDGGRRCRGDGSSAGDPCAACRSEPAQPTVSVRVSQMRRAVTRATGATIPRKAGARTERHRRPPAGRSSSEMGFGGTEGNREGGGVFADGVPGAW